MRSIIGKPAAALGVAAAVLGLLAGNAAADPPGPGLPLRSDVVGVGSSITDGLMNALASL
jgi:hypothetical protein